MSVSNLYTGKQLFTQAILQLKAHLAAKLNSNRKTAKVDLTNAFFFFFYLSHSIPRCYVPGFMKALLYATGIHKSLCCIVTNMPREQLFETELFYLPIVPLLNHIYKQCIWLSDFFPFLFFFFFYILRKQTVFFLLCHQSNGRKSLYIFFCNGFCFLNYQILANYKHKCLLDLDITLYALLCPISH